MTDETRIINEICSSIGAEESTKMYTIINTKTGETKVCVSHESTKRMPITEIDNARMLYRRLTVRNGRRAWSIEDLAETKVSSGTACCGGNLEFDSLNSRNMKSEMRAICSVCKKSVKHKE